MPGMNDNMNPPLSLDADPNAITIEAANARIAALMPRITQSETIPLANALGRYLSSDLNSPMSSPPFRASAMDGYAFRHADDGSTRRVIGKSLAGHPGPDTLQIGECVRVMTGARVPHQADTVVQQENIDVQNDHITIGTWPDPGHHIREVGSDCHAGVCLANAGTRINSGLIGLCSALGIETVSVLRQLHITVLSTGDELQQCGQPLRDGQIYDANAPLLQALLTDPSLIVTCRKNMLDSADSIDQALTSAATSDAIITSGGVSVGTHDFLREVMASRGGVDLWKVAMKPGRPLSFGLLDSKTPWFGLPGNPVSAALTTLLFVIPALRHSQGAPNNPLRVLPAICTDTLKKLAGRVEFQRGILTFEPDGQLSVSTTGLQDSHVLSSLAKSNCFIRLPVDSTGAMAGELVEVIPYEFIDGFLT